MVLIATFDRPQRSEMGVRKAKKKEVAIAMRENGGLNEFYLYGQERLFQKCYE